MGQCAGSVNHWEGGVSVAAFSVNEYRTGEA